MTTIPTTIDAAGWLRNHMESADADSDLLAAMLKDFAEALIGGPRVFRTVASVSPYAAWSWSR